MNAQSNNRTSPLLILVIGVIIGLLIAGAFALVKSGFGSKKAAPSTTETRGIVLSITKPADGDVVSNKDLTIEGSSGKDAVVVVTGPADDAIVETSGGKFSATFSLSEGENELSIYAFDTTSGESGQTAFNVLYLKEELGSGNILVAAANSETTDKNKERIEKLRERLATKSAELKKAISISARSHVFGSLTAISGSSITMETKSGGLITVFTDDLTKFLAIGDQGKSEIAFSDLRLGDKVSVVGVSKDSTVGSAKFVIRIGKSLVKRAAVAGKVKSIDGASLTLTHIIHTDRTFTINTTSETKIKVKGKENATLADVKVDDIVVASGTVDEKGVIAAKRIFVIPGGFVGAKPKESTKSATPSSTQ